jgi:hypothetical protein
MDYGNMIGDSFEYTKEAVMGKWVKWILLIIPFMTHGYAVQIFKSIKPAPEVNDWVANFINGIKLAIIAIIYLIPVIIIGIISFLPVILAGISGDSSALMAGFGLAGIGMLVCALLAIVIYLFLPIAFIRFSRTDRFGEAFNFSGILSHIGKIGWVSYIISFIVIFVVMFVIAIIFGIIGFILMIIPILGWLLYFILELLLIPPVGIFIARYFTQVYDSVGA